MIRRVWYGGRSDDRESGGGKGYQVMGRDVGCRDGVVGREVRF